MRALRALRRWPSCVHSPAQQEQLRHGCLPGLIGVCASACSGMWVGGGGLSCVMAALCKHGVARCQPVSGLSVCASGAAHRLGPGWRSTPLNITPGGGGHHGRVRPVGGWVGAQVEATWHCLPQWLLGCCVMAGGLLTGHGSCNCPLTVCMSQEELSRGAGCKLEQSYPM